MTSVKPMMPVRVLLKSWQGETLDAVFGFLDGAVLFIQNGAELSPHE